MFCGLTARCPVSTILNKDALRLSRNKGRVAQLCTDESARCSAAPVQETPKRRMEDTPGRRTHQAEGTEGQARTTTYNPFLKWEDVWKYDEVRSLLTLDYISLYLLVPFAPAF